MCLYNHRKTRKTTNKPKNYDTFVKTAHQGRKENMTEATNNLIPIKEAAAQVGKTVDTLKNWARAGRIRAYKLADTRWYVDPASLNNLYKKV